MSAEEFIGGVVAGVVAIVVWEAGRRWWRLRRLRLDFGHLAGDYALTRKLTGARERGIAKVEVSDSQLNVKFVDLPDGETITGMVGMNEAMPRSGRGQYHHVRPGEVMWGFWDVQVVPPDKLLVHTTYAHGEKHYAVVSGFVWTQVATG